MKSIYGLALALLWFPQPISASLPGGFYWVNEATHCSGTAASQAALQALFDQLEMTGGTLVFPAGATCRHINTFFLGNPSNSPRDFVIEGNGATLLLETPNLEGGIEILNAENFEVRNLILDGGWDNGSCGTPAFVAPAAKQGALRIIDSKKGTIVNVTATRATGDGFAVREQSEDIHFLGVSSLANNRHGLTVTSARRVKILGGVFAENCGAEPGQSTMVSSGIRVEPNGVTEPAEDLLIRGAEIRDNIVAGFHTGCSSCTGVTNIRVLDSTFRRNGGGAIFLNSGQQIKIQGNLIEEHSEATQGATLWVGNVRGEVAVKGNRIAGSPAGEVTVKVSSPSPGFSPRVRIADNIFRASPAGSSPMPVISYDAGEGRISGNLFDDLAAEAIVATGARLEISGNVIRRASGAVLLVDAPEARVIDNHIEVSTAGGSGAGEAVVRILRNDNTIRGNTLLCADNTQRGLQFGSTGTLVTNNVVSGCDTVHWLSLSPPASVEANNVRTGNV